VVKIWISCKLLVAVSAAWWSLGVGSELFGQASSGGFLPKPPPKTMSQSVSSGFKRSMDAIGNFVSPKRSSKPPTDPTSLGTQAKPSPDLHVAFARLHHQNGRLVEATKHYQTALNLSPNHMGALLGYARANDQLGKPEKATQLYRTAAKAHPNKASVFNNLGLSYAKRGLSGEALEAMGRAVQLEPKNAKYRNNMATLLVDAGRNRDAYAQLRAVQDHTTCLYNLGYLLNQRGQTQAAVQHYTAALKSNPSFAPAQRELQLLTVAAGRTPTERRPSGQANMTIVNNPANVTRRNPQPNPSFDSRQGPSRQHVRLPSNASPWQPPERARDRQVAPVPGPWHRQPASAYGNRYKEVESVPMRVRSGSAISPSPELARPKRLPPVAPIRGIITDIAPMPGGNSPSLGGRTRMPNAPLPPLRQAPRPY
jgi:tetratricopeptide (TPR) repeat protein